MTVFAVLISGLLFKPDFVIMMPGSKGENPVLAQCSFDPDSI